MDFALTDEQRMLEETLTRLVADQVSPEQRRALLEAPSHAASPCGAPLPNWGCCICRSAKTWEGWAATAPT